MTLPMSGPMTAAMINNELGRSPTAPFSIGASAERALAEVPSGSIALSDFYGKSNALLQTTITIGRYYARANVGGEIVGGSDSGETSPRYTQHGWLYGLYRLDAQRGATNRAFSYTTTSGGSISNNNMDGRVIRNLVEEYGETTEDWNSSVGTHPTSTPYLSMFQLHGSGGFQWNKITVGNTVTLRLTGGDYTNAGYLGKEGRYWVNGGFGNRADINNRSILGNRRSGTHLLLIED